MTILERIGLVMMLFAIFLCVAVLAAEKFLAELVCNFMIGAGLFFIFRESKNGTE